MEESGLWGVAACLAMWVAGCPAPSNDGGQPSASASAEADAPRKKPAKRCSPETELADDVRYVLQQEIDDGKDPCPNWAAPVLSIEKEGMWLDGESIAGGAWATGNLVHVGPLFEKLKNNRESWKSFHPNKPFAGKLKVEAEAAVGTDVGISALQTAAFAGYPNFDVTAGKNKVAFGWLVPGPPDEQDTNQAVFIERIEKNGYQVGIHRGQRMGVRWPISLVDRATPPSFAEVGKWFDEHCKDEGGNPCLDRVRLRAHQVPFSDTIASVQDVLALPIFAKKKPGIALSFSCLLNNLMPHGPRFPFRPRCPFGTATEGVRKAGAAKVEGELSPGAIQRVMRANFSRFRLCYQNALGSDPSLEGRVTLKFSIAEDGTVEEAEGSGDIADDAVVSCSERAVMGLEFPKPTRGAVKVEYPLVFTPSG